MTAPNAVPQPCGAEHRDLIADIDRLVALHGRERSAMLPVLQELVRRRGAVGSAAMQVVADRLGVPPVEVQSVVSFYSFLHGGSHHHGPEAPAPANPTHVVRLCRTVSCELAGAGATAERLRELLAPAGGDRAEDVRLEFVHCIGLCDHAPAMLVDDAAVGGVTPDRADALVARLRG